MKIVLLAAAVIISGIASLPATPASAQGAGRVLDIFGDEKCPQSNGEEIVVCRRLPMTEKYRIPKDLREAAKEGGPENWTSKYGSLEYVGSSGTDSCSPEGGGGWTGCWSKMMRAARADRKNQKKQEPVLP
jgi:hypothetical protein